MSVELKEIAICAFDRISLLSVLTMFFGSFLLFPKLPHNPVELEAPSSSPSTKWSCQRHWISAARIYRIFLQSTEQTIALIPLVRKKWEESHAYTHKDTIFIWLGPYDLHQRKEGVCLLTSLKMILQYSTNQLKP